MRPLPDNQGRIFLWSVVAYGASTVVFGFSRSFWLTLIALAGTGLADAISTVIRQTIRQFVTPDRLRGRMTSINMIFFMGGPQLGELEAGLVASLFASTVVGVTVSVVSGGFADDPHHRRDRRGRAHAAAVRLSDEPRRRDGVPHRRMTS